MKKSYTALFLFGFLILLPSIGVIGQNHHHNQWVWMSCDSNMNRKGTYGIKGVANPSNQPGVRYAATNWTDNNGKFWVYGGMAEQLSSVNRNYADLWMFDPATNLWTWIGGDSSANAKSRYGVQSVPDVNNNPGIRKYHMASWKDSNGDLWIFGGYGNNAYNTLFRYDLNDNTWTWMGGDTVVAALGVYGTLGVPSTYNVPGARCSVTATWADNSGNLYLFGGQGYGSGSAFGYLNDLWMYNINDNTWTWLSGDNIISQPGVYGTLGVPAPSNKPGGRMCFASWMDNDGNLWLFGGYGHDANGDIGVLNDVWKYSITNNEWTWMSGSNIRNPLPQYGPFCGASTGYNPTGRLLTQARWTDQCGNMWFFGGEDIYSLSNDTLNPDKNDLWRFNVTDLTWKRIKGDTAHIAGYHWGVKGVPAYGNSPGSNTGANAFLNDDGLWMLGGACWKDYDPSAFNTLRKWWLSMWKYIPDSVTVDFNYAQQSGLLIDFSNTSNTDCGDIKNLSWNFGDPSTGADNISTLENPSHSFSTSGSFNVTLSVTDCFGKTEAFVKSVTVQPAGIEQINEQNDVKVWPNPATDELTIETPDFATIQISDIRGQIIRISNETSLRTIVDLKGLAEGIYIISVKTQNGLVVRKIVKQ